MRETTQEKKFRRDAKPGLTTLALTLIVVLAGSLTLAGSAQDTGRNLTRRPSGASPLVLGHGVGLFKIGRLLAQDDFADLNNWVIQVQEGAGLGQAVVEARNHALDCLVPGRGCTAWFKQKFQTRVAITYDVLCPTHRPAIKGVQPRDINNFWMATDPADPIQGLFDPNSYTGSFGTYDKMFGTEVYSNAAVLAHTDWHPRIRLEDVIGKIATGGSSDS